MRESLFKMLSGLSENVTTIDMLLRLGMAFGLSLILYFTYRLTFSTVAYNRKFNASLVMITLVTTSVMMVIGTSVALSLGMVGALSIVRFRTAIKDPRDAAYIFWSIAIGLCAGTGNGVIGLGTTVIISAVLLLMGIGFGGRSEGYILIIRGDRAEQDAIMAEVNRTFKRYMLKSKHTSLESIELVYQVKIKNGDDLGVTNRLYQMQGIKSVNVLAQSGETVG